VWLCPVHLYLTPSVANDCGSARSSRLLLRMNAWHCLVHLYLAPSAANDCAALPLLPQTNVRLCPFVFFYENDCEALPLRPDHAPFAVDECVALPLRLDRGPSRTNACEALPLLLFQVLLGMTSRPSRLLLRTNVWLCPFV